MEILRAYSDEDIYAMRMSLAKHWQAFMWPQVSGPLHTPTPFILRVLPHQQPSECGQGAKALTAHSTRQWQLHSVTQGLFDDGDRRGVEWHLLGFQAL